MFGFIKRLFKKEISLIIHELPNKEKPVWVYIPIYNYQKNDIIRLCFENREIIVTVLSNVHSIGKTKTIHSVVALYDKDLN